MISLYYMINWNKIFILFYIWIFGKNCKKCFMVNFVLGNDLYVSIL